MIKFFKLICLFVALIANVKYSYCQSGGLNGYEFLNTPISARAAGLGGLAVASYSNDLTLVWQNPSLLQSEMNNQLAFSYVSSVSSIRYGQFAFAKEWKKVGNMAVAVQYANYGDFIMTDVDGTEAGTFSAGEYAIGLSYSKALDSCFFIGTSIKSAFTNFYTEKSSAICMDVAATYKSPDNLSVATFVVKNLGREIEPLTELDKRNLPFEIQMGISTKLENAPFKFSLIAQHLEKWDLTYKDPNKNGIDPLTGENKEENFGFFDKAMRHAVVNLEVLFTKNFNLRFGYNFLRRSELKFEEKKGMAGFGLGFGIKINRFNIDYARSILVPFASNNIFTIRTNLDNFKKKQH